MSYEFANSSEIDPALVAELYGAVDHVAITMDGNGRWAKKRLKPRTFGHRKGAQVAIDIVKCASALGVKALTMYAFSYENWQRSAEEVGFLLETLLQDTIKKVSSYADSEDIRLRLIGEIDSLPPASRDMVDEALAKTQSNSGMVLNFAISYSGRREIVAAVNRILQEKLAGGGPDLPLNEETFARYLQTDGLPEPDLHIRCGGVNRLSNFMLWQMAYTELYAPDILWPDFTVQDFADAIRYFQKQPRKYGRVPEE